MIDRLPLYRPFTPSQLRWRLVDAQVEGPAAFGLPASGVTTDGGGYWTAEFNEMRAATPMDHRALRGMAMRLRGGVRIDVPYVEQAGVGDLALVGFEGGVTFSDGTGLMSGSVTASLEEDVALMDDTALIRIETGQVLLGGDVFSLDRGDPMGSEMHVTSHVEEVEPGLWSVIIGPQFRQAHEAGTVLDFNEPHCAMRLRDPEGSLWPAVTRSWIMRPSALFMEAVR